MSTRSHTTFKKRQKELARQEKQREKAAKRMQRKLEKSLGGPSEEGHSGELELSEPYPEAETP